MAKNKVALFFPDTVYKAHKSICLYTACFYIACMYRRLYLVPDDSLVIAASRLHLWIIIIII